MLDYCSNVDGSSPGYQTPSPTMASFFNMNMNFPSPMGTTESQRQSAFILSSPQLAALHNMTEMKTPSSSSPSSSVSGLQSPYCNYTQSTLKQLGLAWSQATPHRISDILSRSTSSLGLSGINAGMYLNPQVRFSKLAELPGRPPIYWPGILNNPAWRPTGKVQTLFHYTHVSQHEPVHITFTMSTIYTGTGVSYLF